MQLFFLGVEPDEGQAKKGHQSKEVDEGVSLHKRRRWEPPTTPPTPSRPRTRRSNPLGRRQPLKAQLPVETTVTNRTPTSETQAFVSSSSCCFLLALTLFFIFTDDNCVSQHNYIKSHLGPLFVQHCSLIFMISLMIDLYVDFPSVNSFSFFFLVTYCYYYVLHRYFYCSLYFSWWYLFTNCTAAHHINKHNLMLQ